MMKTAKIDLKIYCLCLFVGTALGSYIYTDGEKGASNAIAVLTSPVMKQAHYTCTLTFWYFMRGGKYVGPLKVYVVDGDRLTLLKRRSYHWGKYFLNIIRFNLSIPSHGNLSQ